MLPTILPATLHQVGPPPVPDPLELRPDQVAAPVPHPLELVHDQVAAPVPHRVELRPDQVAAPVPHPLELVRDQVAGLAPIASSCAATRRRHWCRSPQAAARPGGGTGADRLELPQDQAPAALKGCPSWNVGIAKPIYAPNSTS